MTTPKELADKAKQQSNAFALAYASRLARPGHSSFDADRASLHITIDQLQAMAEARQGSGEPVAWSYELATRKAWAPTEHYTGWEPRLSKGKPNVPAESIRNLTPLYPPSAQQVGEPVAWCALTPSGKIEYFDGKPMVMPGPVGNECHPTPLVVAAPPPAQQAPAAADPENDPPACEPSDWSPPAGSDGDGSVAGMARRAAQQATDSGQVPTMPMTDDREPSHIPGYDESDIDWLCRNSEALTWLIDNHAAIRKALAAATQAQPDVPLPVGLTRTDGKLRVSVMRREANGNVTCVAMAEIDEDALTYTRKAVADALAAATQAQPEVTDEMVTAYLKANDAYWQRTDTAPPTDPSRWRNGNPLDATRESLRAALAAATKTK